MAAAIPLLPFWACHTCAWGARAGQACLAGTPRVTRQWGLVTHGAEKARWWQFLRPPCLPDPKVLPGARRVLGFSPVIIDRHVSRFLLAFLTDDLGGL